MVVGPLYVGRGVREYGRYRTLELNRFLYARKAGGVENLAFGAQTQGSARMAHAVLAGAQGVHLIAFGGDAQRGGRRNSKCCDA